MRRPGPLERGGRSYEPLDLGGARLYPLAERESLVRVADFGRPVGPGVTAAELYRSLPRFLGANSLRNLAVAIVRARRAGRPVVFAMGAHVVKVGCGPLVIDLIERGIVSAVAVNGAFAIHDYEVAAAGATSENVDRGIRDGSFGWARETGEAFTRAARAGAATGVGLGRALGREILEPPAAGSAGARPGAADGGGAGAREARGPLPNAGQSVLASAARLGIPCTVHVAVGTDVVHMHPEVSGADLGASSYTDFRIVAAIACDLEGGVWVNIGSAVLLPEVFLKVVSIARNRGHKLEDVTAANLDMLQHYRTDVHLLTRPVKRGISIFGHHEITIPLLRIAILCEMEQDHP